MKQPYSLSLFQMAFWFFLVITAYVFIRKTNPEPAPVPNVEGGR